MMFRQFREQVALERVGREIANHLALGRVSAELFQMSGHVFHSGPPATGALAGAPGRTLTAGSTRGKHGTPIMSGELRGRALRAGRSGLLPVEVAGRAVIPFVFD